MDGNPYKEFMAVITDARLTARNDTERLAAENLPLVPFIVRKFLRTHKGGCPWEHLMAGMSAIYRSAEGFDASRGFAFSTYACHGIYHALLTLRRGTKEDRHETPASVAGPEAFKALRAIPASRPEETEERDAKRVSLVRAAFRAMREDDADIVRMYFFDGLTYREIGEQLGVTKERIRQRVDRAIDAARSELIKQRKHKWKNPRRF